MNSKLVGPILAFGMVLALGVGFYIGKQGGSSAPAAEQVAAAPAGAPAGGAPAARPPAAPQNKGMSPEEVAKAKNVPAVLEDPSGDYQIVAVIEGAEANRKLTQNLQVVGAQRQQLLALTQQFDRLPADSTQQRELVAGELLKVRRTLEQNLQFMAQAYAYSLRFNYRLVPHLASLNLVEKGEDDKPVTRPVHQFENAKTYEEFQKLREDYLLQTVAEVKAAKGDEVEAVEPVAGVAPAVPVAPVVPAVPGTPAEPVVPAVPGTPAEPAAPAEPAEPDFEPSEELKAMEKKLIADYGYDPKKNYQIDLEKTALYARPGQ